jgi:predicted O-methyltransferase YrrM
MEDINEIKQFARENDVPIVQDGGLDFILKYIKDHPSVKRILEIGTAIGYSATQFANVRGDIFIDTIEIDIDRYQQAVRNIHDENLMDRITVYLGNALAFDFGDRKFDLIFIDAAKAQYINYFEHFKNNLSEDGVFISDNLFFHGFVNDLTLTHNYSTVKLIRKLRRYIEFLKYNQEFKTEFFSCGDGMSLSRRRLALTERKVHVFSDSIFSGIQTCIFSRDPYDKEGKYILTDSQMKKISQENGDVRCAFIRRLDDPEILKQKDGCTAPDMWGKFSFSAWRNGQVEKFDATCILGAGFVALNYIDLKMDKAIFVTEEGEIPVTRNFALYEFKLPLARAGQISEADVFSVDKDFHESLAETNSDFYADKISLEGLDGHPLKEGNGALFTWVGGKRIYISGRACLAGEGKRFLE